MNEKQYMRSLRGIQSKRAGEVFENIIEASLIWYRDKGAAAITKTPEPMKPLSKPNQRGQFLACFTKSAQPDFKGTLKGGRSVVFEAKHTDGEKIEYSRLTDEQIEKLSTHHALGAAAFVLVSFGLQDFYRIPWEVWANMANLYGHKHMKKHECEPFRVPCVAGVIKLLDGNLTEPAEGGGHE
ncbi:MAG: Holliday junction resolvase RecU [Paludibacteraceae bacterium]|nr:Holliday junction resolvase RecU [Paludibacteraceae bacterium]